MSRIGSDMSWLVCAIWNFIGIPPQILEILQNLYIFSLKIVSGMLIG